MNLNHREIGRVLGFPECCIHQWIEDRAGFLRGGVCFFRDNGTLGVYVPCDECIHEYYAALPNPMLGKYFPPGDNSDIPLQKSFDGMFIDNAYQPIIERRGRERVGLTTGS